MFSHPLINYHWDDYRDKNNSDNVLLLWKSSQKSEINEGFLSKASMANIYIYIMHIYNVYIYIYEASTYIHEAYIYVHIQIYIIYILVNVTAVH